MRAQPALTPTLALSRQGGGNMLELWQQKWYRTVLEKPWMGLQTRQESGGLQRHTTVYHIDGTSDIGSA